MPGNTLFDPKEVEDFIENGGVSHNTKLARDRALGHFLNYVKTDFSIELSSSHVNILQHLKMKMVNTGKRCLGRRLKITV